MLFSDCRWGRSLRASLTKYGHDISKRPPVVRLLLFALFLLGSLIVFFSYPHPLKPEYHPTFHDFPVPKVLPGNAYEAEVEPHSGPPSKSACSFAASAATLKEDLRIQNYSRAVLRPTFVHAQQPSLTRLNSLTFSPFRLLEPGIRTGALSPEDEACNSPVAEVDVEYDPTTSHTESLLIGMTTPLTRFEKRLNEISYYLLTSKASLLLVVPGNVNIPKEQKRYRDRGLDVTLVSSTVEPFQRRYFSLIRELSRHISSSRPQTRWVATVDDDTFFPRLTHLGARLATLNSTEFHWIGSLSESMLNVKNFGHFSYGGAGIFLSRALLDRLDANYDDCGGPSLGQPSFGGDHRITKCIRKYARGVELEVWKELRQWDLRGHPAGLFESGKPIWTFHHWGETGWFDKDVLSMCGTANVAGQSSILQRFMLNATDGNNQTEARSYYILTNGFSIVKYDLEAGVPDINFDQTEYTWADNAIDYEDFVGPFREVNVPGIKKKRWLLDGVIRSGGNVHQKYLYEGEGKDAGEHSIIEVIWLGPGV